ERALLHHTGAADRHVWVELPIERRGPRWRRPIEATHLVRAVIRTEARPDTSDVHLRVESFGIVIRRVHRADGLAGRLIALLTEHRQEYRAEIRVTRTVVSLDPDPRHLAAIR